MWGKLKIIIGTSFVFFLVYAFIQFYAPDRFLNKLIKQTGTLRVESIPSSSVFINDKLIGQTPIQTSLKNGVYGIKLVASDANKKLITYVDQCKINVNSMTYINRELGNSEISSSGEKISVEKINSSKGQIIVNSDPPSLFVSLDGDERGISPLVLIDVNPGEHEISLSGEGFNPRSIKIYVTASYKLLIDTKLSIDKDYEEQKNLQKKEEAKINNSKSKSTKQLEISNTETGWLRVRTTPSLEASEAAKVNTGDKFVYFTEVDGWYEIEYQKNKRGFVNGEYINVLDK